MREFLLRLFLLFQNLSDASQVYGITPACAVWVIEMLALTRVTTRAYGSLGARYRCANTRAYHDLVYSADGLTDVFAALVLRLFIAVCLAEINSLRWVANRVSSSVGATINKAFIVVTISP